MGQKVIRRLQYYTGLCRVAEEAGVSVEEASKNIASMLELCNRAYGEGVHDVVTCGWIAFGAGVGIGVLQMILRKPVKKGYGELKTKIKSRKEKKQVFEETGA